LYGSYVAIAEQDRLDDFVDDHLLRNLHSISTTVTALAVASPTAPLVPAAEPDTIQETEEVDR